MPPRRVTPVPQCILPARRPLSSALWLLNFQAVAPQCSRCGFSMSTRWPLNLPALAPQCLRSGPSTHGRFTTAEEPSLSTKPPKCRQHILGEGAGVNATMPHDTKEKNTILCRGALMASNRAESDCRPNPPTSGGAGRLFFLYPTLPLPTIP